MSLEEDDELAELEQRLKSANMPEHALKVAKKELKVSLSREEEQLLHYNYTNVTIRKGRPGFLLCRYSNTHHATHPSCPSPFHQRLRSLPAQFPEHAVSRNYLETLLDMPWSTATTDHIDLAQAKLDLDKDHYGLDKVKQRVLEFLAVRKLKNSLKGARGLN